MESNLSERYPTCSIIQSNHSRYVANSGISLVSLEIACETSAKASGIPGTTVQFLNPNQKDDVHNLALLFADVFMEREPVIHALTRADEEQREKFRLTCQKEFAMLASSAVAVVAKTADNTIVAGVILTQWRKREGPYPAPVGLEPMYDLFDRLDAQFARHLANRADPERQTLELLFGGVRRDFESHGIVADLIWIALLYACHHGYEEVMTEATSRSQRTRSGLVTLAEVPYQDFEYQGTRPFETISSPATAKLMWARPETFFRHYPDPLTRRAHL